MNSIKRNVFVTRKALNAPIPYTRATNAQALEFKFCDFQIPENSEARVYVQKPSGKAVYDNAAIDGNTVIVDVTTQMFCEQGICYLQIQLIRDEKILVTFIQPVEALPNYTEGDSPQSKNEAGFFQEFQTQIETVVKTANETIKELEDKAENGDFNGPPGPPGPPGPSGEIENLDTISIEFTQAENRENIESEETIPTVFGKIKKFFADVKDAAFYNVVNNVTQTEAGQAVLDAAVGKWLNEHKLDIGKIVESVNITEPGFVMGGKTASEEFAKLNSNIRYLKNWSISEFKGAGWNIPSNAIWGGVIRTFGRDDTPPAKNDNAFILNAYGGVMYSGYLSTNNPNTIVWHRIGG